MFVLAIAARLAFLFGADEPLLYTHQYQYLKGGLTIAEHPDPVRFVLASDDWHVWGGHWTFPPLYHVFLAALFRVLGPHLLVAQIAQCAIDAVTAVMVGFLGRRIARGGSWAGVAYAIYWPAVTLPATTMSENLHTPLLVGGLAALTWARPGRLPGLLSGLLLGFSGLARTVSLAFVPVAGLWRWRRQGGARSGRAALLVVAAAAAAVLPWTARNVFVIGDPLLVDSVSFFNLWTDNAFVDEARYERQAYGISKETTPAARRAAALELAWLGVTRNPGAFLEKVAVNFEHFFRPEGLHQLLIAEFPHPTWRHVAKLVLDDAILLVVVPLLALYLLGGPPSPVRALLALWTVYYLFMVVVVFHNEIRYRSAFVPFAIAGAVGGVTVLRSASLAARGWIASAVALAMVVMMAGPYVAPAWRAARAARSLSAAASAVAHGDLRAAHGAALEAARLDPHAARPWLVHGRRLSADGHVAEALDAYRRAEMRKPDHWIVRVVLPRLLEEEGRHEEAVRALARADEFSTYGDAWLALEIAWRELPARRADELLLGRGDYGAVRGFHKPMVDHRWSHGRAWFRLQPTVDAPHYDVTVEMGSPEPSPLADPVVSLRGPGAERRFTLTREVRPYTLRVRRAGGDDLVVELRAPTWSRAGEPAEQGVRVDRLTVTAVR